MKTPILVIVFALSCLAAHAQYTAIPDSNFEQALIDLGIDSEGGPTDGQVLTADINTVTTLNIPSKGISDLTGIADFTLLERLFCNQNSLTSLDLSNNMALTQVNCYFNTSLSSLILPNTNTLTHIEFYNCNLSSIDLTPYTNLDFLRSYNNPSLGSLDVTNSPNLEYLYCYNNGLNSLDVSQNPNLLILDCYQNNLTSLDVSNNTSLTRLWCHQNDLTDLDVTQNTSLTSFYCHLNQLSSLDVSQNILLDRLWCYSNQLTSLDVSNNTILTNFRCHLNQLNSLTLPVTNTLSNFWCYSNNLTSLDVSGLTGLDYLDCGINSITSLDVSMIATLTQLYCNSNALTYLNLQNGANSTLDWMWAQNNPSLTCIQVDDVAQAQAKPNWDEDDPSYYNTSCALGMDEFGINDVLLYPNPVISRLQIDLKIDANYSLSNMFGQVIQKGKLVSGSNELNIEKLSTGLYLLNLETVEGKATKKIIKE